MTTKTQSIVAAIAALLTSAGITVREDTESLYSFETKPCIVVDCGDEAPVAGFGTGYVRWDLSITLYIGADGAIPKLAPEPTRATAHTAMYADRTLGGLVEDIVVGQISRSIDPENPAAGITAVVYAIKYRALEGTA